MWKVENPGSTGWAGSPKAHRCRPEDVGHGQKSNTPFGPKNRNKSCIVSGIRDSAPARGRLNPSRRLNGIQHCLFAKKYVNEDYVSKHVVQRKELEHTVKEYPPHVVSRITGVPEEDIIAAADILGRTKSLLSTALQGVYQSNQATASACAINNINLLLGHIGKPGSGIYQMNGQPTAQNNREAGCDGEYPGFRNFSNPDHMQELADLWNIDYIRVPHWNQPTHIENMLKFIADGSIEMFWINGTNPLVSLPNLPMVRELLTKESLFVIAQDIFPTETTAIADVVLPAAAWGEKTGCFTNVDRT
ncbi:hypothetical protein LTS06_012603, partial [Exophiala xenobiotica]